MRKREREKPFLNNEGYARPIWKIERADNGVTSWMGCLRCGGFFNKNLQHCPRCERRKKNKTKYMRNYMKAKRDPDSSKYDERYKTRDFG